MVRAVRYSPPTQAETQFSQPQHEPVAHGSQKLNPPQSTSDVHAGAHARLWNMQTWPAGHGSSSSHLPGWVGEHAARQSSHSGQLDVAQPSHTVPGEQLGQASSLQASVQVPVEKIQSPPGQSSCVTQGPCVGPVVVVLGAPPLPVAPSRTTLPPHAAEHPETTMPRQPR
jgi:hypothetical protein